MKDEGYIKYSCEWEKKAIIIPGSAFDSINSWRKKLFDLELIGVYDSGVGFGNISLKNTNSSFFISGSATGKKINLKVSDYAIVSDWNYKQNRLKCTGLTKASSESLSHAAVYESDNSIGAVIHVHSAKLWKKYLNILPTTDKQIQYGTPEMASAIHCIMKSETNCEKGILIMGGHEQGILSFGRNLDEAGEIILHYFTSL